MADRTLGMKLENTQKQVLAPQMIQSARILQMNAQELSEYLKDAAMENPVIDLIDDDPAGTEKLRQYERLSFRRNRGETAAVQDPDDEDSREDYNFDAGRGESLGDYLRAQLVTGTFTDREREILEFMIESLSPAGYLEESTGYLAERFLVPETEIMRLLHVLQGLDPAGVGARNIPECLLIQAERNGVLTETVRKMITEHLTDIAENRLPAVAKELGISLEEVREACGVIRRLNPKPGNSFSDRQQLRYITPDVLVIRFPEYTDIVLNDRLYPGVGINEYYSGLFRESRDPAVREYLGEKIRQAEWIRSSIARRDETLLRIARQIYLAQEQYFTVPGSALHPYRLSDCAKALNIHESTVSRAIRGKYLQCPRGVYPLHYFFPGAAQGPRNDGSSGISNDAIRRRIREIIASEDRSHPLSDQKICDLLAAEKIEISRRAIAKYREEMDIPAAYRRKIY